MCSGGVALTVNPFKSAITTTQQHDEEENTFVQNLANLISDLLAKIGIDLFL